MATALRPSPPDAASGGVLLHGRQLSLHRIRSRGGTACGFERRGDSAGAIRATHGLANLGPQALGRKSACGEPAAGTGDLDPPRDLELIAPERYDAHRHAVRQRLLGCTHAAVRDRTHRALEHEPVRNEAFD